MVPGLTLIYCLNNLLHMRFQGRPMICAQHQNAKGLAVKISMLILDVLVTGHEDTKASLLDKGQQNAVPGRRPACLEADRYIVSAQSMRHPMV